jgi:Arginyl tRNA synthetase N terminal domain
MNLYAKFHELIAAILGRIAAQGRLPADLDLQRFGVEPPRDPAHGDLSANAAMVYAKEAKKSFANPRQLAGTCDAICTVWRNSLFGPTRIVEYGDRSQPPDFVSPCGVAAGEAGPITLKRAFCSSVNEL